MGKSEKKAARPVSPLAREVWGIIFLFLGLFTLLALLSYDHADPSFLTQTKRLPANFAGRVGSNVAEAFIQAAGLSSFVVALLLFTMSVRLFRGSRFAQIGASLVSSLVLLATAAAFVSLVFGPVHYGGARIPSGGMLGDWIARNLQHALNLWGAALFCLCFLMIALVFSTPFSAAALLRTSWQVTLASTLWTVGALRKSARAVVWAAAHKRRTERLIETKLKPSRREPVIGVERAGETDLQEQLELESEVATESAASDSDIEFMPPIAAAKKPAPKKAARAIASAVATGSYVLPRLDLLNEVPATITEYDKEKLKRNAELLKKNLEEFGVTGDVMAVRPGPVITMYEFKPGPGEKISRIEGLSSDLALALAAESVRIAPIPGKNVIGIEIPNDKREIVFLREILASDEFQNQANIIPLALGNDIAGKPVVSDIARMPHLLVAGASGKGKSVFINSLICSLLYRFTPNDLRLIMVDPKQVELNLYEGIPHLLLPVVDDPRKASTALRWATNEMERRYKIMAKTGMRNLAGFNAKLERDGEDSLRKLLCPQTPEGLPDPGSLAHLFEHDDKGQPVVERMPTILVIIDEFADLMMTAPKDVEVSVARLGQKARAAGIHLVIATQRPSVDVITGLIKANLPSRVAFQTSSKIDSRTILDGNGAENLLGMGDMLFIPPGLARLTRVHGAFVNEEEIGRLCAHWRAQGAPVYKEEILIEPESAADIDEADGAGDELYSHAIAIARELGQISTSMVQRRLKIGYNRAARIVEAMEAQGLVGPADGAKPREVLM